jgi:hypothetical protein
MAPTRLDRPGRVRTPKEASPPRTLNLIAGAVVPLWFFINVFPVFAVQKQYKAFLIAHFVAYPVVSDADSILVRFAL